MSALFCCAALAAPVCGAELVRLGLLAPEGAYDALRSWGFLESYLTKALPGVTLEVQHLPHSAMRAAISRGQLDFFVANSGFYIEAEAAFGASPVATLDSPYALSPTRAIASTVLARADRQDLRGLGDLKGQRVVAVRAQAFGGYQLGMHALKQAGVEPRDLKSIQFTGLPEERMLDAVQGGRADAAILRSCLFERLTAAHPASRTEFKVVGGSAPDGFRCGRSSELYPDWPFAMLPKVKPDLAKRLSVALLSMPRSSDGYAWTVPTDYSGVRRVFRDLEIGPYAYLAQETLGGLVFKYRYWLAIAALALGGGLLHIVRAESLVRSRTRALRAALAERDHIAQEARARERQLDHLSRLGVLGEMSTMLAHELNQPLSAIGNYARGIVRRIENGRGDLAVLADASDQIACQAERAAGILQRVRDFARNRTGERQEVDLRDMFDESLALFQGLMPGAAIVEHRLDPSCLGSARVWVDRLQISQVLINILKNACDAMSSMPPAERRVVILCHRGSGLFLVDISDNGPGLESMPVHALFEPFATTKTDGLGLGLAICKRVIEAHGGHITARNNDPDPGLTFTFTLPSLDDDTHA